MRIHNPATGDRTQDLRTKQLFSTLGFQLVPNLDRLAILIKTNDLHSPSTDKLVLLFEQ